MLSRRGFVGSIVTAGLAIGGAGVLRGREEDFQGLPADAPQPRFSVRDFGAKGDGVTNDTAAFQRAAEAVNRAGGGTLVIPRGVYVVGAQDFAGRAGAGYAFRAQSVLAIRGCRQPVLIEGAGATLRAANGLRFGSFHPVTGRPHQPTLPFTDYNYRADAYHGMINLTGNADVTVRGVELDGNAAGLVLGGMWGDKGWQCAATGIAAYSNAKLSVEDVHTHHHGLDGVLIGFRGLTERDAPRPHSLTRVRSEYNARQGLSWVGGIGLTATDCKFSHTGKGRFSSAPGAGVDIEAEESVCRNGRFVRCEMVNNTGGGMVADSGNGGYSAFEQCVFWGTTSWSVFPRRPGLRFTDCRFHGSIPNPFGSPNPALAVQFVRCHFEDREHPSHGVYRSTALVEADGDNILFDGCTLVANRVKGVYIDGAGTREILRDTRITHRHAGVPDGDFQSLVRGASLQNVRFADETRAPAATRWYISVDRVRVGPGVEVVGPNTRWGHRNAPLGRVAG
jgi:hypothetical protein